MSNLIIYVRTNQIGRVEGKTIYMMPSNTKKKMTKRIQYYKPYIM